MANTTFRGEPAFSLFWEIAFMMRTTPGYGAVVICDCVDCLRIQTPANRAQRYEYFVTDNSITVSKL